MASRFDSGSARPSVPDRVQDVREIQSPTDPGCPTALASRSELGDPKVQREKFDAISPLRAADKIRIPVFIAHGGEDRVADSEQSHRLAKILKKSGTPYETMFAGAEGHGFFTLKNRIELYQRIEAFLKKNL